MSSSLRRGTLAATALALAVASLSACAAGRDAQTIQIHPNNAATAKADIKVENVVVVTGKPGGPASVTARIFNNGSRPETLKSVSVQGAGAAVKLTPAKGQGPVTVPASGSLLLGGKGNATAELPRLNSKAVANGNAQPVTFALSRTGNITLKASVLPGTGDLSSYAPAAGASAPAASPSGSPSGKPSASASASPSGSASPKGAKGAKPSASASASKAAQKKH